jgi:hypothetical protein
LKIGDVITVVEGGKEYEGRVGHILAIASPERGRRAMAEHVRSYIR